MNPCPRRPFRRLLPPVAILIVAMLLVFGRVSGFGFLMYDDEEHVVRNPRFNPVSWQSVGAFWTEQSYWGLYIPLSYTFFAAEAALSGQPLNPAVFHLGSLALHIGCVLLVFAILRRMTCHTGAACAGALLFGLHPVQVESVAWVSEARGLLCALFSLLALWVFDVWSAAEPPTPSTAKERRPSGLRFAKAEYRGRREARPGEAPRDWTGDPERPKAPWTTRTDLFYLAATAALFLALLSKPAAVAVPGMAAVWAVGFARRSVRRTAAGLAPWLVLAAGWIVLTKLQQPSGRMGYVTPLWGRPLIAGDALAFYLAQWFAPIQYLVGLAWDLFLMPWKGSRPLVSWATPRLFGPDYGRSPQWVLRHWWAGGCWTFPFAVAVMMACLRNRRVWLSAAAIALVWLLPVLGLVMFDFQRISTVADRYLYVAVLGPAMALAWWLSRHWNRWAIGGAGGVLCLLGVLSFVQTGRWRDNESLVEYALYVNPTSALALQHRGTLLNREGKPLDAIPWYRETIRHHPQQEEAYINLAQTLVEVDRAGEAEQVLRVGFAELPVRPAIPFELGNLLSRRDAFGQAIPLYEKVVALDPEFAEARLNLGLALEKTGQMAEAEDQFRAALRILPGWPKAHYNLANRLAARGARREAERNYRAAIQSDPTHAKAHTELASLLLGEGRIDEAIWEYRQALRCDPGLVAASLNLGQVLASEGQFDEAVAVFRAAFERVPADSAEADFIGDYLEGMKRD